MTSSICFIHSFNPIVNRGHIGLPGLHIASLSDLSGCKVCRNRLIWMHVLTLLGQRQHLNVDPKLESAFQYGRTGLHHPEVSPSVPLFLFNPFGYCEEFCLTLFLKCPEVILVE